MKSRTVLLIALLFVLTVATIINSIFVASLHYRLNLHEESVGMGNVILTNPKSKQQPSP